MASKPTFSGFKKSGFYTSASIPSLQEQLAKYKVSDSDIRAQAQAEYEPAYNMQKTVYQNQLAELSAQRDRDVKKLNTQFDHTLNSVMTGLNSRGLGRSSLVSTRGVETENARNSAISDTSYNYLQQENQINANIQQADAEYAQNVENRALELKREYQSEYVNLMATIAQLQQNGYSAYANYLLKK